MITGKTLAKNIVIQTIGKLISISIGLVTIGIMTRALGVEHFGEYTTIITFIQFFGILVDFGLSLTLLVMLSEHGANEEKIAGNFLGLRLVSGFLLFGLAPFVVLLFPYNTTIKFAMIYAAISYFIMGGATLLTGIFQKHASMWRVSVGEIINKTILLVLVTVLAWLHFGVIAFVACAIVANIAWLISMILFAKPFVRVRPIFDWSFWKTILSRSWPIAVSVIFNLMYLKGDILLLSLMRNQTEVGYYGVAYRVLDILTAVPVMFMGLMLPSLTHAWTTKNIDEFRSRLSRAFDAFMIFVVPIIFGAQILGRELIAFIAGAGYETAGDVLKILILALFGVFVGSLFGHIVVALNKQRVMVLGYASAAIITIAGYLYFIPLYGMTGAAWMTVFSETLIAVITFIVVYKTTRALPHLSAFIKSIFGALVMSACIWAIPSFHVILTVIIGAIVYFLTMLAIGGIKKSDVKLLLPERFARSKYSDV